MALSGLVRAHIGPGRLGALWLWAACGALGWAVFGVALLVLEEGHGALGTVTGAGLAVLGVCCLVPSAVFVALGVVRDRRARRLLDAWGELDRDRPADLPLRSPAGSAVWLLLSYGLCAVGLFVCVGVPAKAVPGEDTYGEVALWMGLGFIAWLTGLIGLVTAFGHRRWVRRTLAPPVRRAPADAPR